MGKLIVFMHVSLDGFVAGPNGEMDWIKVDEEMFDYAGKQTDLAGTALYGRTTYEMMDAYWPTAPDQPNASAHDIKHGHWYNQVQKVVLSTTIKSSDSKTTILNSDVPAQVEKLKQDSTDNILVFGSPTAVHTFLHHQLIDEFWLFVNPIILGTGIPMFKDLRSRLDLSLLETVPLKSGVICLHYKTK